MTNVDTTTIRNEKDEQIINSIIDLETKRKINKVKGSEKFGIMTACFINGEFTCITDYEITEEMFNNLKNA